MNYEFDKLFSGKTRISVDGKDVFYNPSQWVKESFKTVNDVKFEVGEKEKHQIEIKVIATVPVFSGLFPYKYEVYVDNKLINTYKG